MSQTAALRVTIALCTRNGGAHLAAQLASYVDQSHDAWDLWVSDDGSADDTMQILHDFAARHGAGREIRVIAGPRAGVAANFLSLLCHPAFPAQPAALSDQDDVWLPHKLALGLADLGGPAPVLHGAQSLHTDAGLRPLGRSLGGGVASFGNALTQNIVSGHSAMLNAPALALVRAAGVPPEIPYHDWWLYQLIAGAGGRVVVHPDPVLLYRQHGANAMGSHQGPRAVGARLRQLFGRTYGGWFAANTAALRTIEPLLDSPARATLAALARTPRGIGTARPATFRRHGLVRQGRADTAALHLAVALGRV